MVRYCKNFDHAVTLQRLFNKVYLESGGGASDLLTRIGHREASNLDREDAHEGKGGALNLVLPFGFGTSEETHLLLGL